MTATARPVGVAILGALAVLAACTAGPAEGTLSLVTTPMALTMPTADPGTAVIDENGLARLDRFPYVVRIELKGPEIAEPIVALWPEVVPGEVPEDVELEVSAPPGSSHELHVVMIAAEGETQVTTYVAPGPDDEPLRPLILTGEETVVDVAVTELPTGTVDLNWPDTLSVAAVAWVDLDAAIALPGVEPQGTTHRTELAVGRSYYPLVTVASGATFAFDSSLVRLITEGQYEQITISFE